MFKFLNMLKKYNPDYEEILLSKNNKKIPSSDINIKLLIIADTHTDLALNKSLSKKLSNLDYDLCCILGDVHEKDYEEIFKYIEKDKIIALLGNHDRFSLLSELGLKDINDKVISINGIKIGGLQGSHKYKNENYPMYTHEESIDLLNQMEKVDILLTHDKPFTYDYKDPVHDGLKGITKYLYEKEVPFCIHGHIHKKENYILKNGTKVRSSYGIELLEIKNNEINLIK